MKELNSEPTLFETPEEARRYEQRIAELGRTSVKDFMDSAERYHNARFSYRDIVEFAKTKGKSAQEAGKIFTRYIEAFNQLNIPLPNEDDYPYEQMRDEYGHPVFLLSAILRRNRLVPDDAYGQLLREFHDKTVSDLLVK